MVIVQNATRLNRLEIVGHAALVVEVVVVAEGGQYAPDLGTLTMAVHIWGGVSAGSADNFA